MGLIDNMAEQVRRKMRSFLRIEPAQTNVFQVSENLDFYGNAAKNRVWYRGDANELGQLHKALPGAEERLRFWAAVPTAGREILKTHTGMPAIIVDTLSSIVLDDMSDINVQGDQKTWDTIAEENDLEDLLQGAVADALIVGDGAFRISFIPEISDLPIIEFVPGDRVELVYTRGRLKEAVFRSRYIHKTKEYTLEETYGIGYINTVLLHMDKEVPLNSIPETESLAESVKWADKFSMAVPFKIFKSGKYENRGGSIFDKKAGAFDNLDETWSQWMDALRKARTKEYIPENMLPRNPETGELLKPNAFDNAYIKHDAPEAEGASAKIEVEQPTIPADSYLNTYMTALDLCLQGLISPSTLGIDVKKLDNADAQREKEKATLYTRDSIIKALRKTLPVLVDAAMKAYATWNKGAVKDTKSEIPFGEYANPSFESQVETITKGRVGGILSIEASIEELYGDSKEDEWKAEEVARLKAEQGIAEESEPAVNSEVSVNIASKEDTDSESQGGEQSIQNDKAGIPRPTTNSV